ncbi:MAG: N-acetyl-gamma-glutamyl-phosphate reductase [Dysgonamonadaceae bacterium]|jgi:N-acetyl-gamma-glutamyl-phosphate reductase|nr:N-acetyl-gamma-glutamyl-phosphate reductase [Dysgonamonadaceae bacterium]
MKIKIGIIGGAGYTAGELIRLLMNHPAVEIVFIHSGSNAGNRITDIHGGLAGETDVRFSDGYSLAGIDALFLCSAHGESRRFMEEQDIPNALKIIDLSMDYRHKETAEAFVYGLPELNKATIAGASRIANPGCFATAIQLALLPLAAEKLLKDEIHVHAVTGSTGAGVKPGATSHFSWRDNNLSVYKAFEHQHLKEIKETILGLQSGFDRDINFIPVRGDFPRGIFADIYTCSDLPEKEAVELYRDYYSDAAFTHVYDNNPDLKQVVNTNKCILHIEKHGNKLFIVSVIDNLLKGASGQALQNFNLLFGLEEKTGLQLKASAF